MRNLLLFLVIFFIGIIQSTALEYLSIFGAKPDILLISVIFFTLYLSEIDGIKAAILGGLFKDVTSTAIFGSNAFALCASVLFLSRYGGSFYKQRLSTQILLCGVVYYITELIVLFINYSISKGAHIQLSVYLWSIFKTALYTAFVSPLIFFILSKIFRVRLAYD